MPNKKLKIAVYSGDIPSTTFIERLIIGLSTKNYKILLFGFIKSRTNYPRNVYNKGYYTNKFLKGGYLAFYTLLLMVFRTKDKKKLDKILKQSPKNMRRAKLLSYPVLWYKPDIFHVQWAKSLSEWMWVKEFNMKLVLSLRGAHINYSPIADSELAQTYRAHFPDVDAFHAVSKNIAAESTKYGASGEKIKVVYSGLDLIPNINKSKSNSSLNIVSIGRSHWIKGYAYAIDAMSIARDKGLTFNYTIVGGADNIELMYKIQDSNLNENVELLGSLPHDMVIDVLSNADLLLLPSLKEGMPNVVLEAMLCKTLVLTTACGGVNEVIRDEINGFLVPNRNPEAMAEKIVKISQLSDEQITSLTDRAYNDVQKGHSLKKMVEGMSNLYTEVLN